MPINLILGLVIGAAAGGGIGYLGSRAKSDQPC